MPAPAGEVPVSVPEFPVSSKQFPNPLPREIPPFSLIENGKLAPAGQGGARKAEIPCIFTQIRESESREPFAVDCQHSHALPNPPGTSTARTVGPNLSLKPARFRRPGLPLKRQRPIFRQFRARPDTKISRAAFGGQHLRRRLGRIALCPF